MNKYRKFMIIKKLRSTKFKLFLILVKCHEFQNNLRKQAQLIDQTLRRLRQCNSYLYCNNAWLGPTKRARTLSVTDRLARPQDAFTYHLLLFHQRWTLKIFLFALFCMYHLVASFLVQLNICLPNVCKRGRLAVNLSSLDTSQAPLVSPKLCPILTSQ